MDPRLARLDLKTSFVALCDLALPRRCVVCERLLLPMERHICSSCLCDMPQTYNWIATHNPMADTFNALIEAPRYEYAAALFRYSGGYKHISKALKFSRHFEQARFFASMLSDRLKAQPHFSDIDCVVPVPLHWTRFLSRGYNQSGIIAAQVASELGVSYLEGCLVRRRRTRRQAKSSSGDRMKNVSGAFEMRNGIQANHVLIVDDIFTTGATLAACYAAMREKLGPQTRISVAALGLAGSM